MLNDFFRLIYPSYCLTCEKTLVKGEKILCLSCLYQLPKLEFSLFNEKLERIFLGRVKVQNVFSFLSFEKGNMVQKLMSELKYHGEKQIAELMGTLMGVEFEHLIKNSGVDLIIPVPLHPKKFRKRGFNQSAVFGSSLAEKLQLPFKENIVQRIKATSTQTKKSRYQRWENVSEVFKIKAPYKLKNKHVLVVDDVLTTGATIEALAHEILAYKGTSVSVATMAVTKH